MCPFCTSFENGEPVPVAKEELFKVEQSEDDGSYYVTLDLLTSAYIGKFMNYRFAVVTESSETLPFVGYVLLSKYAWDVYRNHMSNENGTKGKAIADAQITMFTPAEYRTAIKIQVIGKEENQIHARDSSASLSYGALRLASIKTWASFRYVPTLWMGRIWKPIMKQHSSSFPSEEPQFDPSGFYEVYKVHPNDMSPRQRLLLMTNVFYNYWHRHFEKKSGHAGEHLSHFGFKYDLKPESLGIYFAEAGCGVNYASVVLKQLKQTRHDAIRYYRKHPGELMKLHREGGMMFTFPIPSKSI